MDPLDPTTFTHKQASLQSGHTYHYVDEQPETTKANGKTIICLHGFPDLWFGWRYQIRPLVDEGYRVIVPSQLGYHESSKPKDVREYGMKRLSDDIAELLKVAGVDRVIVLGHDWGGWHAYRFAEYHPGMVEKVASVCTPYFAPSKAGEAYVSVEDWIVDKPNFNYQLLLISPAAIELLNENILALWNQLGAKARLESAQQNIHVGMTDQKRAWAAEKGRAEATLRAALASGRIRTPKKEEDPELYYYYSIGKDMDFTYPLNWYKTREQNHKDETANLSGRFPEGIPVLYVACGCDQALPPFLGDKMDDLFPKGALTKHVIETADHWVLQDPLHHQSLTETLIKWFKSGQV